MSEIFVPDTSVIIDGRISRLISKGKLKNCKIVIPEAVVSELENQALKGRETGYAGLDELKRLKKLSDEKIIELEFYGKRPKKDEYKDIDDIIRNVAKELNATLITSDRLQAMIAKSKGIKVKLIIPKRKKLSILKYFDEETMSVHLKENVPPLAKKGKPGDFRLVKLDEKPLSRAKVKRIIREILEFARYDKNSFLEIDRKHAIVVQIRDLRIAIAMPPFSDGYEVTIVRPTVKVRLEDYNISEKLLKRLKEQAEGIIIAGPPGSGKSTFAQALAEFYKENGKIVKTMESPRDLQVSDEITQYSPLEGDMEKTADILLLVRPDYTIYDEMRKTRDFKIYTDMRMAGVGMIGVVHANRAIDALQRFIGRVDLGLIPQIVDTIIFIKDAKIDKVYKIEFTVKVPTGMVDADLARPVIEVRDFETDEIEYEIYTFGEETIVMPIKKKVETPIEKLAKDRIFLEIKKIVPRANPEIILKNNYAEIYIEEDYIPTIIGKEGKRIEKLEKKLGINLYVYPKEKKYEKVSDEYINVDVSLDNKFVILKFDKRYVGKKIEVYVDDEKLFIATISRKGEIKIGKNTNIANRILRAKNVYAKILD